MLGYISQLGEKLTLFIQFSALLIFITGCNSKTSPKVESAAPTPNGAYLNLIKLPQTKLVLSSGDMIQTFIASTSAQRVQGLSGIRDHQFKANQGMLFYYNQMQEQRFWMPDTYFNLDIFFLDKGLKVIDVARNVPHHPGKQEPPAIAYTQTVYAQHVLELRADSPVAAKIKKGTKIMLSESISLEQIISGTRPSR